MDYFTKKEISGLKSDIIASNNAIEADKVSFENQLKNHLGKQITDTLNNVKTEKKVTFKQKLKKIIEIIKKGDI